MRTRVFIAALGAGPAPVVAGCSSGMSFTWHVATTSGASSGTPSTSPASGGSGY